MLHPEQGNCDGFVNSAIPRGYHVHTYSVSTSQFTRGMLWICPTGSIYFIRRIGYPNISDLIRWVHDGCLVRNAISPGAPDLTLSRVRFIPLYICQFSKFTNFTHSLTHTLTSLINSHTNAHTHQLTEPIHLTTFSPTHPLAHSFTHPLAHPTWYSLREHL